MKQLLILLLFISGLATAQQRVSKDVQKIVNTIAARNVYESERVGFAGSPSGQYKKMKELKKKATVSELIFLARSHKNGVVKIYAWQALQSNPHVTNKDKKTIEGLHNQLMHDTTRVSTLMGCVGGKASVATLLPKTIAAD